MSLKELQGQGTPLQEWMNEHLFTLADDLIYKKAAVAQAVFVRDTVLHPLVPQFETREANPPRVVSCHRSKSCLLPVYSIDTGQLGVQLVFRGNFFNWMVSVDSSYDVPDNFFSLVNREPNQGAINPVYCEGFKDEWVFDTYTANPRQFTIPLPYRDVYLWTFFFLLAEGLREHA